MRNIGPSTRSGHETMPFSVELLVFACPGIQLQFPAEL